MISDNPNTLTHQYNATNNTPWYPSLFHCYMEYCPGMALLYAISTSMLVKFPLLSRSPQELSLHQYPAQGHFIYLTQAP